MKNYLNSNRRNFLRGIGGSVLGIPWFESLSKEKAPKKPNQRAAWFYVPIGVVRRGFFPNEAGAAIPKFTGARTEVEMNSQDEGRHLPSRIDAYARASQGGQG